MNTHHVSSPLQSVANPRLQGLRAAAIDPTDRARNAKFFRTRIKGAYGEACALAAERGGTREMAVLVRPDGDKVHLWGLGDETVVLYQARRGTRKHRKHRLGFYLCKIQPVPIIELYRSFERSFRQADQGELKVA